MRILGIAGSLRKDSYNRKLLAYAAKVADGHGQEIVICDLGDIPLYNGDVEAEGMPPPVAAFRERIAQADAVLFAGPEYNNSISGVLKNAIDWASRPPNAWNTKVVAVMGATQGGFGTVQASAHLRHVMSILNCLVVPLPFVYLSRARDAFDEQGNLVNATAAKNVEGLVVRLIEVTASQSR